MIFKKSKQIENLTSFGSEPENPTMSDESLVKYLNEKFTWKYDPFFHKFLLPIDTVVKDSLMVGAFLGNDFSEIQFGKDEDMVHIQKIRGVLHKANKESREIWRKETREKQKIQQDKEKQYLRQRDSVLIDILENKASWKYHTTKNIEILDKHNQFLKSSREFREFFYGLQTKPCIINGKKYEMHKHHVHRSHDGLENKIKIKSQIGVF